MKEVDDEIKKALSEETRDIIEPLDEASYMELFIQSYKGKNRWLNFIVLLDGVIAIGLIIWSINEFLSAETVKGMLGWTMLFTSSLLLFTLAKIWGWMQINKNAMIRETKRVEMQMVRVLSLLENQRQS
ncbi:MAG: hypothetical protein MI748_15560 [Opitutales bacterium]|nr:hypothetical protein [Opitutales bacterium]